MSTRARPVPPRRDAARRACPAAAGRRPGRRAGGGRRRRRARGGGAAAPAPPPSRSARPSPCPAPSRSWASARAASRGRAAARRPSPTAPSPRSPSPGPTAPASPARSPRRVDLGGHARCPAPPTGVTATVRDAADALHALPLTADTTAGRAPRERRASAPATTRSSASASRCRSRFDRASTDPAARAALVAPADGQRPRPAVEGAWRWMDDRTVHYRPPTFWKPGTRVAVRADLHRLRAARRRLGLRAAARPPSPSATPLVSTVDVAGPHHDRPPRRQGPAGPEGLDGQAGVRDPQRHLPRAREAAQASHGRRDA